MSMSTPFFSPSRNTRRTPLFLLAALSTLLLTACNTIPTDYQPLTPAQQQAAAPIRFLLTFDDGPSASTWFGSNPTASILDSLDNNPVQPGIKAVFFVQTRASNGGGTPLGHQLQEREEAEGHLVGLHTSTPRGHLDQVAMKPAQLEQALTDGVADLKALGDAPPLFLRPPFWNYNERTFEAYQAHGLHMILTDMSANDGKIYGVNFSLTRRSHMLRELADVRQLIAHRAMPIVDGAIPVIVTFHDINRYTARHIQEYLQILLDSAHQLELPTAAHPFYDNRVAIQQALLQRAVKDGRAPVNLPGIWNLLSHRSE
jgi:peptidoglycan/xylan/chitin deacetylase (PgdA/CDA1 family)